MQTFEELLEKQKRTKLSLILLYDLLEVSIPEEEERYLFRVAEHTNPEYLIIFALREGFGGKKYTYAQIGRLLGKKRCVIRKKYLNCKRKIAELKL